MWNNLFTQVFSLLDSMEPDIQTGTFSFKQMRAATDDFSYANKIGEGGFGPVYKVFYLTFYHQVSCK